MRDRNSYAFALVSVAAIVDLDEAGTICEARIAFQGELPINLGARSKAEQELKGKKLQKATLRAAAETELREAKGYEYNSFKIELAKRCIVRAMRTAADSTVA